MTTHKTDPKAVSFKALYPVYMNLQQALTSYKCCRRREKPNELEWVRSALVSAEEMLKLRLRKGSAERLAATMRHMIQDAHKILTSVSYSNDNTPT